MKILSSLYEYFYIEQIHAVVSWAKHRRCRGAGESLYVSLPHREQFIDIGNARDDTKKQVRVIVCTPKKITETLAGLRAPHTKEEKEWVKVFSSPLLEVWEDSSTEMVGGVHPLRFGLSQKEKDLLLSFARASLCDAVSGQQNTSLASPTFQGNDFRRFSQVCGVDVTLWVNGRMRGSQIVEGLPLKEALRHATLLASEDVRFKPITTSEIDKVQIELTLFSDLRVPLSPSEIIKNEIYTEKGYCMKTSEGVGWYIPAVFNCRTFVNLQHFLSTLEHEKIPSAKRRNMSQSKTTTIFEVSNFIEEHPKGEALSLCGATPTNPVVGISEEECEVHARHALGFLIRMQDTEGSAPLTLSPITGQFGDIDWVRMALAIWSMALSVNTFPKLQEDEALTHSILRGYSYLKKYLFTHRTLTPPIRCFSLIYYHKIAVLQKEYAEMEKSHKHIMSLVGQLSYEPSIYIQIALHIFEYEKRTRAEEQMAFQFMERVHEDFQKNSGVGGGMGIALFADLFNLLWVASEVSRDSKLRARGDDVFAWYIEQQNSDGSFPSTPHSSYAYTRGTGKILEALSKHKISYKETIFVKTFSWLRSMQYKLNNSYFVPPNARNMVLGGFRHDQQNTTLWIDASAHYLIALCQGFLTAKK